MNPQPDEWTNKLPDGRTVVYTSDIGPGRDGGPIGAEADIHLNVAETSTPRVQEVHRTILHAMCSLIDRSLEQQA